MSEKCAPGPWSVTSPGTRQTTYTVRRNLGDERNSVEWLTNKRGRPIRFRTREAALAAIDKTAGSAA